MVAIGKQLLITRGALTTFSVVCVAGSELGSTSIALPWRFQFVAQHERQFWTLNGKPLVHRTSPATDQPPMTSLSGPEAPDPIFRPRPKGRSQMKSALIWWRTSKSEWPYSASGSNELSRNPV